MLRFLLPSVVTVAFLLANAPVARADVVVAPGNADSNQVVVKTKPPTVVVVKHKPPVPAKPSKSVISCRIVCHFDATDESVLAVGEGDVVRVLPKDFQDGGDWVWAAGPGGAEGYVPRTALLKVN